MSLYVYDDAHCKHDATEIFTNPNLLINGDFKIWQRGESFNLSNNSKFNYCADRWRVYDGFTASKASNGITIKGANVLQQALEEKLENGNKYTVSAMIDGAIRIMTFTAGTTASNTYFAYDSSKNAVGIYLSSSTNRTIKWAKLESGIVATPFVPKTYTEELANCQRYYQFVAWFENTSVGYNIISLPYFSTMRKAPTIDYLELDMYGNNNSPTHTIYNSLSQLQGYRVNDKNVWFMVPVITSRTNDSNMVGYAKLDAEIYD